MAVVGGRGHRKRQAICLQWRAVLWSPWIPRQRCGISFFIWCRGPTSCFTEVVIIEDVRAASCTNFECFRCYGLVPNYNGFVGCKCMCCWGQISGWMGKWPSGHAQEVRGWAVWAGLGTEVSHAACCPASARGALWLREISQSNTPHCRWYVCILSTTKGHELSDFHMLFLGAGSEGSPGELYNLCSLLFLF